MNDFFVLQPVLHPTVIAVVIGIALLLLFVGPSFGSPTARQKIKLLLIRLAILCMALVALLRPGCVQKIEKNQSAVLLFLIDATRSMELPHQSDDSSRWGAMLETLNSNQDRIRKLREKEIDVRFFVFDNEVRVLEEVDGQIVLPPDPVGGETDIGTAVYKTSLDVRDQRVVGLVLNSDGVQNALNPEVELSRATDALQDIGAPLYAVGYGLPGDAGQLKDVAIKNFPEQLAINIKNRLVARATIVTRGYANSDVTVQLVLEDDDGNEKIVGSKVIRPTGRLEEQQVEIDYVPDVAGEFRLKIRALPQPGEVALRNNELPAFLSVSDRGMRILLLVGRLNFEQSALRRTIPSSGEGINLEVYNIHTRTEQQGFNPGVSAELKQIFSDPTFDLFIIGDADARTFHRPGMENSPLDALAKAVESGKGLLMLGGFHALGAGAYSGTPLQPLLPVRIDGSEVQAFGQDLRRDVHVMRDIQLRPAGTHYLTRFTVDADGNDSWRDLPRLFGANRLVPKEDAAVLLETDDAATNAVLVGSDVGGRVLVFGGDSTWRWLMRKDTRESFHRFWRQIILWLARWDGRDDESVSIDLPQRRFQPGGLVKFNVTHRSDSGDENIRYQSTLVKPDGSSAPVTVAQAGEVSEGQLDREMITGSGVYKLQVTGLRNGTVIGKSEREFIVVDRDKEKANPSASPELMLRLASETSEFGGQFLEPGNLSELLDDMIENPPDTQLEVPVKWQLGETFYDAAGFLLLFVGLLGIEWGMRKKWGLV